MIFPNPPDNDALLDNQNENVEHRKKKLIIIILISSFAILLIVLLIWYIFIHSNGNSINCEPGFFIPEKEENCKKCFLENCKECYGTENQNNCITCISPYIPFYSNNSIISCEKPCEEGEEEKCLECNKTSNNCMSCNTGYKLNNGKCYLNYSFKAIYESYRDNEKIKLINNLPCNIVEMTVNREIIEPSIEYTFKTKGIHEIYILLRDSNILSLSYMFKDIINLISISFSNKFNSQNVENLEEMFNGCISLTSIDFSLLRFENINNMRMLFNNCFSLKSINCSNLILSK